MTVNIIFDFKLMYFTLKSLNINYKRCFSYMYRNTFRYIILDVGVSENSQINYLIFIYLGFLNKFIIIIYTFVPISARYYF